MKVLQNGSYAWDHFPLLCSQYYFNVWNNINKQPYGIQYTLNGDNGPWIFANENTTMSISLLNLLACEMWISFNLPSVNSRILFLFMILLIVCPFKCPFYQTIFVAFALCKSSSFNLFSFHKMTERWSHYMDGLRTEKTLNKLKWLEQKTIPQWAKWAIAEGNKWKVNWNELSIVDSGCKVDGMSNSSFRIQFVLAIFWIESCLTVRTN